MLSGEREKSNGIVWCRERCCAAPWPGLRIVGEEIAIALKTLTRVALAAPSSFEIMTWVTFGILSSPYICKLKHWRTALKSLLCGLPVGKVMDVRGHFSGELLQVV